MFANYLKVGVAIAFDIFNFEVTVFRLQVGSLTGKLVGTADYLLTVFLIFLSVFGDII